jgi:hypothetical protein
MRRENLSLPLSDLNNSMTDLPSDIEKILRAASAAPSGDNSQPWHFVFKQPHSIEFHYVAGRDNEILNIDASGTLIALGASIENAKIMAHSLGYETSVLETAEGELVAAMELRKSDSEPDENEKQLAASIPTRHSNRKAYQTTQIKDSDRDVLLKTASEASDVSCIFIESPDQMQSLSRHITVMEEIALGNKHIHHLFFKGIFWSRKKNEQGHSGLYIKTLELPPPAEVLFRILRFWPVANVFAKIGFPGFVAKTNAQQNAAASAFGIITAKSLDRQTYVRAGMLLERLWLTATQQGMSFQIVTGVLFLARRIEQGDMDTLFTDVDKQKSKQAHTHIRTALNSEELHPVLIFRVGYAKPATSRSRRRAPLVHSKP